MNHICVIALFLFTVIVTNAQNCPDGAFHAGNYCYLASQPTMTWYAAQEVCSNCMYNSIFH